MDLMVMLGLPVVLLGIVAGIYVATLIHDRRIDDLSAEQYVALHQMRDKSFARVMPALGLSVVALVFVGTAILLSAGVPRVLGIAATALLIADIAIAVRRQVPINRQVQGWTAATIPSDWTQARNRWAAHHKLRCGLGLVAYACFVTAALLTIAQR